MELIDLHKEDGMQLKEPSHDLEPSYYSLGIPYSPESNALGLKWNNKKDTLELLYHYDLSKNERNKQIL